MDLRLKDYYRVNYIPTFISERTPSESREDLWELLDSVGLDYYDRFEWLLRTNMRAANDNLIVERRRMEETVKQYTSGIISSLQYGDKVIVESFETIANTDDTATLIAIGTPINSSIGQAINNIKPVVTAVLIKPLLLHFFPY